MVKNNLEETAFAITGIVYNEGEKGLTKREYACIHLGIPKSGDAELDALIRKAEMKKIAVMVLQGLIARNDEGVGDLLMDAPFYAIDIACALLSELELDKSE